MCKFIKLRLQSFSYAFQGWKHALRNEPNTWIHATITTLVILVALWLHLPPRDWAVLALAIGIVWSAEFFNTAIENTVDLACPEEHPLAKTSKDVSAAGVLITALTSALVGILILGPPLLGKLTAVLN